MFDSTDGTFNYWANWLVSLEIWLHPYIEFNGDIEIIINWSNFDFFNLDPSVHTSSLSIMLFWSWTHDVWENISQL